MLEQLNDTKDRYQEDITHVEGRPPIIPLSDIPTLRSLYRSRRLLQSDQSYSANDSYNRMISICYYDLTRLQVDAIVNNAPVDLRLTPSSGLLHHAVMEGGGPKLREEVRSKVQIYPGKVVLTRGHDLPASWVIHAAGPTYVGSKGVQQFVVLGDCYHNALRTAGELGIKTIALPCLGAGGGGFPAGMAARIALQAVRENLDSHPEVRYERIIFCVKSAVDEKAYMDFFPIFFPPTHGDLDVARISNNSGNHIALSNRVLNAWAEMQRVAKALASEFGAFVSELEIDQLYEIESALSSIRNHLLESEQLGDNLKDLNLLCSVLMTLSHNITKLTERAKKTEPTAEIRREIWNKANRNMHAVHGSDLGQFLSYCWYFAKSLDEVLTQDKPEWDMTEVRPALESYRDKERTQDVAVTYGPSEEAIKAQQPTPSASSSRNLVQLHQIRSVATLYEGGTIKRKPTMAQSSAAFNQTIHYIREDITKLMVDVMVNSTDTSFLGMGTLDRSVFKKGGPELQEEVKKLGPCKEGDIRTTPGYLLPAKHIIHVIPPESFGKNTKNILRNIYRGILHTATFLGAKSVAIPSVGTGMLNYPRRDCAALAMEEVRRFLQSRDEGGLEKIVFVVYSYNDESAYKSLLPVYFPPTEENVAVKVDDRTVETGKSVVDRVSTVSQASSIEDVALNVPDEEPQTPVQGEDSPVEMNESGVAEPILTEASQSDSTQDVVQNTPTGESPTSIQLEDPPADMQKSVVPGSIPTEFPQSSSMEDAAQNIPAEEELQTPIQAQVSIIRDSKMATGWGPISEAPCIIQVVENRVNMYEKNPSSQRIAPGSKPVASFDIMSRSRWIRTRSNRSILVKVRRVAEPLDDRVDVVFEFQYTSDARALSTVLERAIKSIEADEATDAKDDDNNKREEASEEFKRALDPDIPVLSRHRPEWEHVDERSVSPQRDAFKTGEDQEYKSAEYEVAKQNLERMSNWDQGHGKYPSAEEIGLDEAIIRERLRRMRRPSFDAKRAALGQLRLALDEDGIEDVEEKRQEKGTPDLSPAAASEQDTTSSSQPAPAHQYHDQSQEQPQQPQQERGEHQEKETKLTQILTHLTTDLHTRPTSYIGTTTTAIASALALDTASTAAYLADLAARGLVHNTVDANTWVVSREQGQIPVLRPAGGGGGGM